METAYRLTWNPRRPENREDIIQILDEAQPNGKLVTWWRCGNAKIRKGSRIYLLRLGKEPKGIIGVGTALDDADESKEPAVEVQFDLLREDPYISIHELAQPPFDEVAWANQNLAVRIPATVSRALDARLWRGDHAATQTQVSGTQAKRRDSAETDQLADSLASGAGFGNPETNRLVETAAVGKVSAHYQQQGWKVLDVSGEKRGYDLECIKGRATQHVEVKGVAGGRQAVILTENERRQATEDRDFVLAVVTSALSEPNLHLYSAEEMFSRFAITPMIHRAILREQDDGQRQGKSRRGR